MNKMTKFMMKILMKKMIHNNKAQTWVYTKMTLPSWSINLIKKFQNSLNNTNK